MQSWPHQGSDGETKRKMLYFSRMQILVLLVWPCKPSFQKNRKKKQNQTNQKGLGIGFWRTSATYETGPGWGSQRQLTKFFRTSLNLYHPLKINSQIRLLLAREIRHSPFLPNLNDQEILPRCCPFQPYRFTKAHLPGLTQHDLCLDS